MPVRAACMSWVWLPRVPRVDAPPAWDDVLDAPEMLVVMTQEYLWLKLVWVTAALVILTIVVLAVRREWKKRNSR